MSKKEVKDIENEEVENSVDAAEANEAVEESKEPTMEEKYGELNDKYIRIHAEFDNYRKRTNKEKLDIISSANAGMLKDLLSVVDDFERAIQNNETAEDLEGVKEGFKLIYNKFKGVLEAKGLKGMDSTGQPFDVEIHEAIANIPAPSEDMKGKVIEAVEKGYLLNDKVIRFAKVVVGQ